MDYSNKVPQPSHCSCLLQQCMSGTLGSMGVITVSLIHPCVIDEGSLFNFCIASLHLTWELCKWGMDILGSLCNSGQNEIHNLIISEILYSDWAKPLFFTMLGIWNITRQPSLSLCSERREWILLFNVITHYTVILYQLCVENVFAAIKGSCLHCASNSKK